MNKDESLSLAITVGAHIERNSCNSEMLTSFTEHELLAFANACEKIGMEKAAKICEERIDVWAKRNKFRPAELADMADTELQSAADAIRAAILPPTPHE